jgi:tetratricopeptide (TPR) repeat protein
MLTGCAGLQTAPYPEPEPLPSSRSEGAQESVSAAALREHTADAVFEVLAGEIAVQRGDLDVAYEHYLEAARVARDAGAAERATRIAIYQKQDQKAERAVAYWVELAPQDAAARQVAGVLYARTGQQTLAFEQFQELARLEQAAGNDGFLRVAAVLGTLPDIALRLQLIESLTAANSGEPEAHYAYAVVAVGADQLELAELEVRKALARRPDWPKAQILLSRVLLAKGDIDAARRVLEDALAGSPDNIQLGSAYARLLVDAREVKAAYLQFQRLHRLQPEDEEVLFSLGVLALQLEDMQAARDHFGSLYEMGLRRDESAYFIGQIEEQRKRYEVAVEWYERVGGSLELDARVRTARILAEQGQLAQARELLQRMRVQQPEKAVNLYLIEGGLVGGAGRRQEVVNLYTKALQAFPDNPDLLYARALAAAEVGDLPLLESDLQRILEDDPEHADALNALGYTLADQTDRHQEALVYISRALELKPDNAAILDSMGWLQYRLGNYPEALRYLRRANAMLPDAEIAAHLGEVLWVSGEREQARRVWKEALEREPDSPHLRDVLKRFP